MSDEGLRMLNNENSYSSRSIGILYYYSTCAECCSVSSPTYLPHSLSSGGSDISGGLRFRRGPDPAPKHQHAQSSCFCLEPPPYHLLIAVWTFRFRPHHGLDRPPPIERMLIRSRLSTPWRRSTRCRTSTDHARTFPKTLVAHQDVQKQKRHSK